MGAADFLEGWLGLGGDSVVYCMLRIVVHIKKIYTKFSRHLYFRRHLPSLSLNSLLSELSRSCP